MDIRLAKISKHMTIPVLVFGVLVGISGLYFSTASAIYYNCTSWDSKPDKDCDQIADDREKFGKGGLNLFDSTYQADVNIKDIYLEIDYRGHHKPLSGVTEAVTTAFLNSGVLNYPGYSTGIRLHIFVNENMGNPANDPCTDLSTFSSIKNAWFGFSPAEKS